MQLNVHLAQDQIKDNMTAGEINCFKKTLERSTIKQVIALDPYMEYLAKPETHFREITNQLIIDELNLCGQLGINSLIIHPGTCSLQSGALECVTDMSESINEILSKVSGNCMVLLQNMASGNSIFYTV